MQDLGNHRLDIHLEEEMTRRWRACAARYGPLEGRWIGSLEPARRRLAVLVATVLMMSLAGLNSDWSAEVGYGCQGTGWPALVVLTDHERVAMLPIAWTYQKVVIDGEKIALTSRTAGEKIVAILAQRSAAFLANRR